MQVTSKVGKLHSKFGHARPSGSPVIRYVCDGQTKAMLDAPYGQGHKKYMVKALSKTVSCITEHKQQYALKT